MDDVDDDDDDHSGDEKKTGLLLLNVDLLLLLVEAVVSNAKTSPTGFDDVVAAIPGSVVTSVNDISQHQDEGVE